VNVLLIDIGNTRIKWARFDGKRVGRQHAAVHSGWGGEDYARRVIGSGRALDRILVVSVAGARVNRSLTLAARRARAPAPGFVISARSAGGVTNGYLEPWRLGVDRFVAAIGAYHLAAGKAVCVVGVGTAMTIDLVDVKGGHRGGAIIPAPTLMVDSLLNNTAALIDRAVGEARALIPGRAPLVMLTGGGASLIQPLVRSKCVSVPDLVLRGLAALCAEPVHPPPAV
jgi:type III pantothenate kinase